MQFEKMLNRWDSARLTRAVTMIAAVLVGNLTLNAASLAAMLYVASDTVLKATTGQASTLPANQKCALTAGQALEITSAADGGAGHYRITLPREYFGCALTQAYVYQPHVSLAAATVTVHTATFFKKTTASASTLPAGSKCAINPAAFALTAAPTISASHYAVTFKTAVAGCGFTAGYLYTGHANAGVTVLSLPASNYLKTSTADAATLPLANKCLLTAGNYVMTGVPTISGLHYNVALSAIPAGCGLKTGYVYYDPTLLAAPPGAPTSGISYVSPMPGGVAYAGDFSWCVCRNIGTSPHIGQDWNAPGQETSRAVADGTIMNKTFVNGCGHYVWLEDTSGAVWRYLHLNANNWQIGDTVVKGQQIGVHGDYPIVGQCGSGPHLHLERRSAGGFKDSEVVKTCQFGATSCNFDPNKPFPGAGTTALKRLIESVSEPRAEQFVVRVREATHGHCRRDPASYPRVETSVLNDFSLATKPLAIAKSAQRSGDHTVFSVSAALAGNTDNRCAPGANCLLSWQALAETPSGLKRMFVDASIRNRKAQIAFAEQLCLPADATGRIHVLASDFNGKRVRNVIDLE
jgi:hypothetical protein